MIASSAFFALDGILGWPAVDYDGSWSQWGQMSATAADGGMLASNSPWRTDILTDSITYNFANGKAVEMLTSDGSTCSGTLSTSGSTAYSTADGGQCTPTPPNSFATSGNQIEDEDAKYMSSGGAGGGGGTSTPHVGC